MRNRIALVLVVCLFAGLETSLPAAAAKGPPAPKKLDVSKSPKIERPVPEAPQGRFAKDGGHRPAPKRVRERVEERSASSETWENDDGTLGVVTYASPHYYKPDPSSSAWQPIDTGLAATPGKAGVWHSKATPAPVSFAPLGASGGNVQVALAGANVGFAPSGANPAAVAPAIDGSNATYAEVWPGVNLRYGTLAGGVKEDIVIKSPGTPATFSFDLVGMTATANGDGGLDLVVDGHQVGTVPAPTVSNTIRAVPTEVSGVALTAESDGAGRAGGRVRISVDSKWLSGLPAKAFPIDIDPTFYGDVGPTSTRSMSADGRTTANVQVGIDGSGRSWRATAQFPLPPPVANNTDLSRPWRLVRGTMFLQGNQHTNVTVLGAPLEPLSFQTVGQAGTPLFTDGGNASGDVTWWVGLHGASWYGFEGNETSYDPDPVINPLDVLNPVILYDYAQASPPTSVSSPTDGQTISTTTPTLTAAPSAETEPTVYYDFKVGTDASGRGTVVDSGWLKVMPGGCGGDPACTTTPQWPVPPGALADGMTYSATVLVGINEPWDTTPSYYTPPAAPRAPVRFTVKQRLGAGGPSPTDTVGAPPGTTDTPSKGAPSPGTPPASVTVNMVTGNLALGVGTRSLQTVSGAAGVTLQYNSGQPDSLAGAQHGLQGEYWVDNAGHDPAAAQAVGRRLDPAVNFDWSGSSPMGGYNGGAPVLARWTGTIAVPPTAAGQAARWVLGGLAPRGGGMLVKVGGSTVYDNWSGRASTNAVTFGSTAVGSGTPSIEVDYWAPGSDAVALWAKNTTPPPNQPDVTVVPSTWLAPRATGLPGGWKLSGDTFSGGWERAVDAGSQVVLQSTTGDTATFSRLGPDYQAPPGNNDLLSVITTGPDTGQLRLSTANAYTYIFNRDGTVASVASAADDRQPAALAYRYTGNPAVLTTITDRVSGRAITLGYAGNGSCPSEAAAPPGMLCTIGFWDATTTLLRYNDGGQLAQVISAWGLSGATVSYFGYDGAGRLSAILDPLGWDATAIGTAPVRTIPDTCDPANAASNCDVMTQIAYDIGNRVASVTQPAPTAGAPRPKRRYAYASAFGYTNAFIDGFTPASVYASRVYYDAKARVTRRLDSASLAATTVWDALDRPIVNVDTAGLETSTFYDAANNVTDTYGPAPVACFTAAPPPDAATNTAVPVANPPGTTGCATTVPHAHNGYDEAITSLAATFWANPDFAGAPVGHSTGPGGTGPGGPGCRAATLCTQWNTLPVAPNGRTTREGFTWSMRLTGTITLPPGTSRFSVWTAQRATLYIDDTQVASTDASTVGDGWNSYGTFVGGYEMGTATAGTHRIRVDSLGATTSLSAVGVGFRPAGGQPNWVPDTALSPAYGLRTSVTDPDGTKTATAYSDATIGAEMGLPTATTVDPAGMGLRTTTTYEAPGTGHYLRKVARSLPAGPTTTYTNYCGSPGGQGCAAPQVSGALAGACGVTAGDPQGGLLASQADPDPDGAGPAQARTQQFVYDPAGHQVGRRVGPADTIATAAWACTAYDNRGRITSQSWPATGPSGPARTVTYAYAVGNNALVSSVTDAAGTISSTVDLLGRMVSYSDVWAKVTTVAYDQAGRTTTTTGPSGTITTAYDPNTSQPTIVAVNGTPMASAGYDPAGRLSAASYANATSLRVDYDPLGRRSALMFTDSAATRLVGHSVTTSPGGRRADEAIDTGGPALVDPNPGGPNLTYDSAGRLTQAFLNGARADYSYLDLSGDAGNGCAYPGAGADTNRSRVTTTPTTGAPTVVDSCYTNADQLASTLTPGAGSDTRFAYDGHANQVTDGASTYAFDAADRLIGATSGQTTVTYVRDALDRLVQRADATGTTRYAYSGFSDAPAATLATNNFPIQQFATLFGGVLLARRSSANVWSYPDLSGHMIASATDAGTRQGSPVTYDPWGAEYPARASVDNASGGADFGADGAAGKLEEHATTNPLVLLGARALSPTEGRFLSVDPIEGGCANAYTYSFGDPINHPDLDGQGGCPWWKRALGFVSRNWETVAGVVITAVGVALGGAPLIVAGILLGTVGTVRACFFGGRRGDCYLDAGALAASLGAIGLGFLAAAEGDALGVGYASGAIATGTGIGLSILSVAPDATRKRRC